MHPSPMADTVRSLLPSFRKSMVVPLARECAWSDRIYPGRPVHRQSRAGRASPSLPSRRRWRAGGPRFRHASLPRLRIIGVNKMATGVSFDLQPVLKGALVELRPLRREDFADLFAVAADPLIWEQHPVKDRYQEQPFRAFFREALESGGALIAIDTKDGRAIGSSRFHGYSAERSEVEIGWSFLARSHWGGHYNGEMKRLMLQHA